MEHIRTGISIPPISDRAFRQISRYVEERCGIKMPDIKKTMIESRLRKRLRLLELDSFDAYVEHVFKHDAGQTELVHMVDAVTTNKTDFFREAAHFRYLQDTALPRFRQDHSRLRRVEFRAWSAGCSTGEEPYTLAMVLSEWAERQEGFEYSILATDLSTRVLEFAAMGVYASERIDPIAMPLRRKYLLRSRDPARAQVRILPQLRQRVKFKQLNLMDSTYVVPHAMHVIFCRNVIIYFDRQRQEQILARLCDHLVPGGYLFLGHSENISGFDLPLQSVSMTVYRKRC